ncbi:MAG TPA: RIO1 family regulatory kinase/ATPase [Actinomycetes bacterium]|nr:RIO1 family regulatory kinase/ATPase [Actinomycetes bacterium]
MSTDIEPARSPRVVDAERHTPLPPRQPIRRRPTGDAPPLPRRVESTGIGWLVVAAVLVGAMIVVFRNGLRGPAMTLTVVDDAVVGWLAQLLQLQPEFTFVPRAIAAATSWWTLLALLYGTALALVILRRFRHLLVLLIVQSVTAVLVTVVNAITQRPRPFGVEITGGWGGWATPSAPVTMVTLALMGILYTLVPHGHLRTIGKVIAAVIVGMAAVARMALGLDAPTDVLVAAALGVALPLTAFRFFTPSDVFPVAYRQGQRAHLDVTGERGEAIRRALEEQLGVHVQSITPIGLAGSAASTPLRVRVAGEPQVELLAKLMAQSHLRSDRWYKLGRELLYGKLEDEAPFNSVRRLVEQEDYNLTVLHRAGILCPAPLGFVEIVPGREYLIVMEFMTGAIEIGDADVDVGIIDDALGVVRRMWDAGIAHRDIKPSNLMIRDGRVIVVDPGFVQVRPSPWRQAVDLANMMLVLGLRADPRLVYERALRQFTVAEICEAFAATRGITMPTQLRRMIRQQGRDLHAAFVRLLPTKPKPIPIQRWNRRRVLLLAAAAALLALVVANPAFFTDTEQIKRTPTSLEDAGCDVYEPQWLAAQAVPTASRIPCMRALPAGWTVSGGTANNGRAEWIIDHNVTSGGTDEEQMLISLTPSCNLEGTTEQPRDASGVRHYKRLSVNGDAFTATWIDVFDGGCASATTKTTISQLEPLEIDLRSAWTYSTRTELADALEQRSKGKLQLDPAT